MRSYATDCRHLSSKIRLNRGMAKVKSLSLECAHYREERGSATDCDANVVTNT